MSLFFLLSLPVLTQARALSTACDTCELSVDFGYADSCLQVVFTDSSTVDTHCTIISRSWTFGDGGSSSFSNPIHTYPQNGSYVVCLTVQAVFGQDTCTLTACDTLVLACDTCEVSSGFSHNSTDSCWVHFSQSSSIGTGSTLVGYNWTFGDGNSSTSANPSHSYASPGDYIVCLTTTAYLGADTCMDTWCDTVTVNCDTCEVTADFSIKVRDDCEVDFTEDVIVGSSTSVLSYSWDFGDGQTSSVANPRHTFNRGGSYQVCLTVAAVLGNDTCYDTFCDSVTLSGCPGDTVCEVQASFTYSIGIDCEVIFQNTSTSGSGTTITSWEWDFGDGSVSSSQNPIHYYEQNDSFLVCLTVFGVNGDKDCQSDTCIWIDFDCYARLGNWPDVGLKDWKVYPNPAADYLQVEIESEDLESLQEIRLSTLHGSVLRRIPVSGQANIRMDLRGLPSGVYLIAIDRRAGKIFVKE